MLGIWKTGRCAFLQGRLLIPHEKQQQSVSHDKAATGLLDT